MLQIGFSLRFSLRVSLLIVQRTKSWREKFSRAILSDLAGMHTDEQSLTSSDFSERLQRDAVFFRGTETSRKLTIFKLDNLRPSMKALIHEYFQRN